MRNVAIFDFRKRISQKDLQVVARHAHYANLLYKESNQQSRLIVLQIGSKKVTSKHSVYFSFQKVSLFQFALMLVNKKYTNKIFASHDVKLIVTGDPWLSASAARFAIKKRSNNSPKIQIQIHADLEIPKNRISFRYLRYQIEKRNLERSDSVRVTNLMQRNKVIHVYGLEPSKVFASALPLNIIYEEVVVQDPETRPFTIGFVGRLHDERGVDFQIEIIKYLAPKLVDLKFVFIGGGCRENWLKSRIKEMNLLSRTTFLGEITSAKMENAWAKVGILVSTAPKESYGRAIRESLVHGIPVLSRNTLGLQSLVAEVGTEGIIKLGEDLEDGQILAQVEHLRRVKIGKKYFDLMLINDRNNVDVLIASWLSLIK
jgi:glycosyltransferase involved in cell wall biosynthesis